MSALRVAWRALVLVVTVAAALAEYALRRLWQAHETALGLVLARAIDRLGGAFTKFGQLLSTRGDVLPAAVAEPLQHLQDRLPPFSERLSENDLEALLGASRARFSQFDPVPFAAASIAQVHAARFDERDVVVKIQRPTAARKLETDLALAATLGRLLAALPPFKDVPVRELIAELHATIHRQLDFLLEAETLRRFKANFAWLPDVAIPELLLAEARFLVLQRLDQRNAAELDRAAREHAAELACVLLFQMVFRDGLIHCDLHPGNLAVHADGTLVLLDFGFAAEVNEAERVAFTGFFMALASGNGSSCARLMLESAARLPDGFSEAGFYDAMEALVARYHKLNARDFEVANFAVDLFELQRRQRVVGSTAFTMTIVAFLVLEGLIKRLHPEFDFQAAARRFILSPRKLVTKRPPARAAEPGLPAWSGHA